MSAAMHTVNATPRKDSGKGAARRLRKAADADRDPAAAGELVERGRPDAMAARPAHLPQTRWAPVLGTGWAQTPGTRRWSLFA